MKRPASLYKRTTYRTALKTIARIRLAEPLQQIFVYKNPPAVYSKGTVLSSLFRIVDHTCFSDDDNLDLTGIFQFRFDTFRHFMAENRAIVFI